MVSDEFHAINQIREHLREMRKSILSENNVFRVERIEFYLDVLEKKTKVGHSSTDKITAPPTDKITAPPTDKIFKGES